MILAATPSTSHPDAPSRAKQRFARASWGALAFTIFVILWGAFVRATGSGAGCGSHWPLCNGEVLPQDPTTHTVIEFTHRATSGLSLLLVLGLFFWARKLYPTAQHFVRRMAKLSLIGMILEALLGAGLVLLELVAEDKSVTRAVSISLHLVNTSFLTAAMTLLASGASRDLQGQPLRALWITPTLRKRAIWVISTFLVLGAAGAITALGDTLFKAESLAHGIQMDLAPGAHFLLRLRVIHPVLAILWGVGSLGWLLGLRYPGNALGLTANPARIAALLILSNLLLGGLNLLLLAPTQLQIAHLAMANLIWIQLILTFSGGEPALKNQ
jgi:heme A synthase